MSKSNEITVPDIGDVSEVDVIEVMVSEGDTITKEQSLITVESDKASMEIPASQAGVVKSIKVKVGDKVKEGSVILEVLPGGEAEQTPAKKSAAQPANAAVAATQSAAPSAGQTKAKEESAAPASAQPKEVAAAPVMVTIPNIGDSTDVEVIEIMVVVGDTVTANQGLITVESDKASMEVPSSHAGVVTAIKVKLGDKVNEGTEILELRPSAPATEAPSQAATPKAVGTEQLRQVPETPVASTPVSAPAQPQQAPGSSDGLASVPPQRSSPTAAYSDADVPPRNLPHASPSVRKFARELGVNLNQVEGSGDKNRITQDDVRQYVKQALAMGRGAVPSTGSVEGGVSVLGWPKVDFAKFGSIETKPMSRIKKIAGANLHRNWVMIPHVTNNDVADITDLEDLRQSLNKENQKSGVKVTMLAFLIKAVVAALKKFPEFNASIEGDNLVLKQYFHIGFAADTPNGLMVPVIRDADQKGIMDLAAETGELAALAREGKLSPAQMQGGCFSISSLGGIGGTNFTPIINAPEVAILGVSRSSHQPVWDGKAFQPRLLLPLSLSYDHRVIDGAAAARFNVYLGSLLADFRRIAL
jgi:pyruvate dehydrogenase E2 component (dihydrolipoamide acetyltransferase)